MTSDEPDPESTKTPCPNGTDGKYPCKYDNPRGSGLVDCPPSLPDGSPCPDCAGTGKKRCPTCYGSAKLDCPVCGGSGYLPR